MLVGGTSSKLLGIWSNIRLKGSKPCLNHLRENTRENRENTKQSKNINNTHQTMLKVGNAKRGKSRKNTEWRVLIMAIPESLSEDPSTCFLLSSLAWRKAPLCRYLLLFSSVFSVLLSKPAILQTCPICRPKASPISPQPPESSPLERPSEKQQKNPAPRAGVYRVHVKNKGPWW